MRIKTKCNNCGKEISTWSWSNDRVELAKSKGDNLSLICKFCNHSDMYHVDNIIAVPNKLAILFVSLIFLIGTPVIIILLWDYIWNGSNFIYLILVVVVPIIVPSLIYGIVMKNDRKRVSAFNRHKIK